MRFVVCGEALIDLLPGEQVSSAETRWSALCGGGPLNTALALARLGEDSHFLGRLGGDSFGAQLERYLQDNHVAMDLAVRTADPTSVAVVSLDAEGRASYTFHFQNTSNFGWRAGEFPELRENDWLHFGSIGTISGPGARAVLNFVRSTPASLSYDINVRPTVLPDRFEYFQRVEQLIAAVGAGGGIVKASDEDISWLVDDPDPLPYAEAWCAEYGLALCIVTTGPDGAVAIKPDGRQICVAGHSIELVDTVGAGDTFMAGFLAAYARRPDEVESALRWGAAASALVCTRQGANPPTRAELEEFLSPPKR
ncbi:carbohydrate kinase family protein [Arachnia rubra]|jgi:fructokinase|uniref:Carbohydrate kinase n=1 Tax=Arachnia rubra TaxID=1547448 RepID=A0ABX7Y863_9ACTN|nr:carbohydrate kinase [Arachnia rubra]MBB1569992.1 carbohydrate kinase [Propionibacterium sp.]MDO4644175.1 carbohydrate kinase [Propionibacteriaceae bacterium]MBB1577416.1 carbohydrate kinase [Propionibacterium sp.]QUC09400.1 carbohydrate kinase [Arachnia rubra]BCR80884.1 ribokinase [Arachnia rubra]